MKKLFAVLSLTAFLSVGAFAQTQTTKSDAPKAKTETKVDAKESTNAKAASHSCCQKANASCCKNNKEAKACTAEQKAECAKAGASTNMKCSHDHAKAEKADEKTKTEKTE